MFIKDHKGVRIIQRDIHPATERTTSALRAQDCTCTDSWNAVNTAQKLLLLLLLPLAATATESPIAEAYVFVGLLTVTGCSIKVNYPRCKALA